MTRGTFSDRVDDNIEPARPLRKFSFGTLVSVLFILLAGPTWAQQTQAWQITRNLVEPASVPDAIAAHPVLGELEIDAGLASLMVARRDLNSDGAAEYFVQSAPSLCGNGGCPYAIFDGSALTYIGQVFGSVIREAEGRFGGWAVLECYSHLSASSTAYGVFAYSGSDYARVFSIELPASLATRLLERRTLVER